MKWLELKLDTSPAGLDPVSQLLEEQGIEGDNITASKQQISQIMDTLIKGFEKQLDQLFSTQAIDINSDIEVLENMMAADEGERFQAQIAGRPLRGAGRTSAEM